MLFIIRKLVEFGYYATEAKVKSLVSLLRGILNGIDDLPFVMEDKEPSQLDEWIQRGRFEANDENTIICSVKARIIRILHLLVNLSTSTQLKVCLVSKQLLQTTFICFGNTATHLGFQDGQGLGAR